MALTLEEKEEEVEDTVVACQEATVEAVEEATAEAAAEEATAEAAAEEATAEAVEAESVMEVRLLVPWLIPLLYNNTLQLQDRLLLLLTEAMGQDRLEVLLFIFIFTPLLPLLLWHLTVRPLLHPVDRPLLHPIDLLQWPLTAEVKEAKLDTEDHQVAMLLQWPSPINQPQHNRTNQLQPQWLNPINQPQWLLINHFLPQCPTNRPRCHLTEVVIRLHQLHPINQPLLQCPNNRPQCHLTVVVHPLNPINQPLLQCPNNRPQCHLTVVVHQLHPINQPQWSLTNKLLLQCPINQPLWHLMVVAAVMLPQWPILSHQPQLSLTALLPSPEEGISFPVRQINVFDPFKTCHYLHQNHTLSHTSISNLTKCDLCTIFD